MQFSNKHINYQTGKLHSYFPTAHRLGQRDSGLPFLSHNYTLFSILFKGHLLPTHSLFIRFLAINSRLFYQPTHPPTHPTRFALHVCKIAFLKHFRSNFSLHFKKFVVPNCNRRGKPEFVPPTWCVFFLFPFLRVR